MGSQSHHLTDAGRAASFPGVVPLRNGLCRSLHLIFRVRLRHGGTERVTRSERALANGFLPFPYHVPYPARSGGGSDETTATPRAPATAGIGLLTSHNTSLIGNLTVHCASDVCHGRRSQKEKGPSAVERRGAVTVKEVHMTLSEIDRRFTELVGDHPWLFLVLLFVVAWFRW